MTTSLTSRFAVAFTVAAFAAGTIVCSAASADNGSSLSFGSPKLVFAPSVLGVNDFAISPDGTQLAMQTNDPTDALQTFDPEDASPSPTAYASDGTDTTGLMMAWSPDSSRIAYMRSTADGRTELDTVSAGGDPITDVSWFQAYAFDFWSIGAGHLGWLDNDHVASIAFPDATDDGSGNVDWGNMALFSVAADGSGVRQLTAADDGNWVGEPVSRGGTTVFSWARPDATGAYADGMWLLGDPAIDQQPTQTAAPDTNWILPQVSPDGTKIAYSDGFLHVYDIATQTTTSICPDEYGAWTFSWSPDGRYVATAINVPGETDDSWSNQIWVCSAAGDSETPAADTALNGQVGVLQWSPNGDQIWWLNWGGDTQGLYRMSVSSN